MHIVTSLSNYARSSIENLKRFWPFPLIYKIFYIPTTFLFFFFRKSERYENGTAQKLDLTYFWAN